jgi:probable phosphoglycerate mutase
MRLLLIRHGETADNADGVIASVLPGPGVNETGVAQAEALARRLGGEPIDAVFASVATRAQQTAAPLAAALGLDVTLVPGLHEITCGVFEGRGDAEALQGYLGTIVTWWTDPSARIPGGEDGDEFFARFDGAIAAIEQTGAHTAAIVSHAGSIRTWASGRARNLDAAFSRDNGLDNAGIVRLEGTTMLGWTATQWQEEALGGPGGAADDPAGAPF